MILHTKTLKGPKKNPFGVFQEWQYESRYCSLKKKKKKERGGGVCPEKLHREI